MITTRPLRSIVCLILTPIFARVVFADATMTRDEVVSAVSRHSRFVSDAATQPDVSELLKHILDELAPGLPDVVRGQSQESLLAIVEAPTALEFSDRRYLAAAAKRKLMEIVIQTEYQQRFGSPSVSIQQSLRATVEFVSDSMRTSMLRHLAAPGGEFSAEEVETHMAGVKSGLLRRIGDPNSFRLTKPIADGDKEALCHEFERRLAESAGRVPRILGVDANQPNLPRAEAKKRALLSEVTEPAVRRILRMSTDPERLKDRSEEYAPGYERAVREFHRLRKELASERMR